MARALHVLVIEDDADVREALRPLLETAGHQVTESVDGAEAMARLRGGLRPSMILLDLMMPNMDGWQFMDAIRGIPALRDVPIVVVSAYGSAAGVRGAGAADYVRKPVEPDQLLETIDRWARSGG